MTSASVLFYNRRSRVGRGGVLDLGGGDEGEDLDSSSDYHLHRASHQNSIRRHRLPNHQHSTARRDLHIDGCDPIARRSRHHLRHRDSSSVAESAFLDEASALANITYLQNARTRRERSRFPGNERLPGRVLLARERLLQRLRGVSLSENRQSSSVPLSTHQDNSIIEEASLEIPDNGYQEGGDILREQLAGTLSFRNLSLEKNTRPPALTQEAINSLRLETFSKEDKSDGNVRTRAPCDCSICLDTFLEGDKLICLPCGHNFHHHCLCPWLLTSGACPYCRTAILLTN